MENNSKIVVSNLSYQFIYQILIFFVPLVVSPYLTRVLGSYNLGMYTYTNSIAYYFIVVANLGISRYGQRTISSCKTINETRFSFWSIFKLHIITSLFSLILFTILIFFINNNRVFLLLQIPYVLSALFDITWLFYGIEDFKTIVFRNALTKVTESIFIFILVKNQSSIYLYFIITGCGFLISQISLFLKGIKLFPPLKIHLFECKIHLKPLIVFSINVLAVTFYTVLDKTLIGVILNANDVAFYEYANKLVTFIATLLTLISTVIYPRACALADSNDQSSQNFFFDFSIIIVASLGFYVCFFLLNFSDTFVSIYYGADFSKTGIILKLMSALPLIIGLGEIFRSQFLLPYHYDKQYLISLLISCGLNLVISLLLIWNKGVYGVVIGTIIAECIGLLIQAFLSLRFINSKKILSSLAPYFTIFLIVTLFNSFLRLLLNNSFVTVFLRLLISTFVYFCFCFSYLYFYKHSLVKQFCKKNN